MHSIRLYHSYAYNLSIVMIYLLIVKKFFFLSRKKNKQMIQNIPYVELLDVNLVFCDTMMILWTIVIRILSTFSAHSELTQ